MSTSMPVAKPLARRPLQALLAMALALANPVSQAQVALGDEPVLSSVSVPGNVALTPSVEWPTGVRTAYTNGTYSSADRYLGYFDPDKCYRYVQRSSDSDTNSNAYTTSASGSNMSHFEPRGVTATRTCSGSDEWSGNFLNWASTPTIDPFRWALTGGNRVVDSTTETILQKARHTGQGGTGLTPLKTITDSTVTAGATPFTGTIVANTNGYGVRMRFASSSARLSETTNHYNGTSTSMADNRSYDVYMRVKVCDNSTAAGGVESNCRQYGSNWKPEGLIQQYSERMRFSAFGYLNDGSTNRDGAVLRAGQKFVGPILPRPGQTAISNVAGADNYQTGYREWDPATGIFVRSPNAADVTATNSAFSPGTSVADSGVINYINKFGQLNGNDYKSLDPVSEMFYAALRYFKNQGNVSSYTDIGAATAAERERYLDNFPAITSWTDPIQYACQRNYILGIGDIYTWNDKNLPGATGTNSEPTKPTEVSTDTTVDSVAFTNLAFGLQGLGNPSQTSYSGRDNSANMVGLAYHANTQDIRPDDPAVPRTIGRQSVQTFWVDVLEGPFEANNQYYLAAKYGGFTVPANFNPLTRATALEQELWSTNGQLVGTQPRPDNYFLAGQPDTMVAALTSAFARIAAQLSAVTTSFSTASPQVTQTGNASYSAQYDATNWTGTVTGSQIAFAANGAVTLTESWNSDTTLANQLAGTGWNTGRRVVTWNGTAGVPFRTGTGNITTAQQALLNTPYGTGANAAAIAANVLIDDSQQYLNYLRGDRSQEVGVTGAQFGYRARQRLLGDIDASRVTVAGAPNAGYSEATNPGYAAFRTTYATRTPIVYVGANDGMLHAFNGSLTGTGAGTEVFAYVPSALFNGPTAPATDGLVSRGNPNFIHRSLVNATARPYDIDFNRAGITVTGAETPNWRTVLIGGLGKGGRSYYAIDVTNPAPGGTPRAEGGTGGAAGQVLWEFPSSGNATHATAISRMGYTYGEPVVTKTAKYGWVVIFPSGYNSTAGGSYLFFVNPSNGNLLETVIVGSAGEPSEGLAHIQGYRRDLANNTTESIYGGDLNGNMWRVDLRGAPASYPTPVAIARFTEPSTTTRQPVTSRPLIEIDPATGRRFVMVGTGRLLDDVDLTTTGYQSFYAVIDGTEGAFGTAASNGVAFPLTRSNLVQNTDTTLAGTGVALGSQFGWYIDLPRNGANVASRVILDPTTATSRVAFATILPSGDACTPSGTSRVYAINFGTGESALAADRAFVETTSAVIDIRFLSVDGGRPQLYVGGRGSGTGGGGSILPPSVAPNCVGNVCRTDTSDPGVTPLRRLNWREILLPQ